MSIRANSWMSLFRIPIKSIIKVINLWSKGRIFTEIKQDVNIFAPVFIRIRKFLISEIIRHYEFNPIRLGGNNIIVQIDETKLSHNVKSHIGRSPIHPIVYC